MKIAARLFGFGNLRDKCLTLRTETSSPLLTFEIVNIYLDENAVTCGVRNDLECLFFRLEPCLVCRFCLAQPRLRGASQIDQAPVKIIAIRDRSYTPRCPR